MPVEAQYHLNPLREYKTFRIERQGEMLIYMIDGREVDRDEFYEWLSEEYEALWDERFEWTRRP